MAKSVGGSIAEDGTFEVGKTPEPKKAVPPPFRIYEGSRIAVSRSMGKLWKTKLDAALRAYDAIYQSWNQVYAYYNNDQNKGGLVTPRGQFHRGDGTENVIFSNLNVLLPAIYMRDPDIACTTIAGSEEPFCRVLEAVLDALFQRRDKLAAKRKIKKAAGLGLLTNSGILALNFTQKDEGSESVSNTLADITERLSKAKNQAEIEQLYGELEALESQVELSEPSGPNLHNKMPHDVIVDPYAEMADGSDAAWMIERMFLPTAYLQARYTQKTEDGHVYVYKPTHKATFTAGGEREDGLGLVLEAISGEVNLPTGYTTQERLSYLYSYMTECYKVWDKTTRRVMLFTRDDWDWPLWVWDDPHKVTRFFPYFFISFTMSIGSMTSVGEISYVLDQQDEINDINRKLQKIRRTVFDYYFYNTNKFDKDTAEMLVRALNGDTKVAQKVFGVALEEGQTLKDAFESILPPPANYEGLFNKAPILESMNRLTNVSDALRGVQFKTNTNQKAVDTYNDAARLSIGAKTDELEDVVADMAMTLAEWVVQNYDQQDVAALVGDQLAQDWRQMSLAEFRSQYHLRIAAGSLEKPNSVFRKQEAVQIAQAVGQFAQGAPGATLKIMLRALEKAFTDVVVKKEDWDAIEQEIQANLSKGVSTQGAGAPPQAGSGGDAGTAGAPSPQQIEQLKALPAPLKAQAMQMKDQGMPAQQIIQFLMKQQPAAGEPTQ